MAALTDIDPYVMLLSSLPSPEALFLAKQPPLSRLKLDGRLRVLSEEDAATLHLIEQILLWQCLPRTMSDADVIEHTRTALAQIENANLRSIVLGLLEIRTCIVALRRRHRGESAPSVDAAWGFGRWVAHISRNWSEPGFRLETTFPWLREADNLMKQDDAVALERLVLEQTYRLMFRRSVGHSFDFEAVAIYVLEWDIADRWGRYNAEAAARRFDELTEAALGAYAALSFEGEA